MKRILGNKSTLTPCVQSTSTKKLLIQISVIALLYGVWKFDAFWGYYQFKKTCEAEGGLRVQEKLQKNVGWEGPTLGEAKSYAHEMPYVKFFRAIKGPYGQPDGIKKGDFVDLRYLGGPYLPDTSYDYKPADLTVPTVYRLERNSGRETKDRRISRYTFTVKELSTKKAMLIYTQFEYSWRHPDGGAFDWFGPSGFVGCPLNVNAGLEDLSEINRNAYKD